MPSDETKAAAAALRAFAHALNTVIAQAWAALLPDAEPPAELGERQIED